MKVFEGLKPTMMQLLFAASYCIQQPCLIAVAAIMLRLTNLPSDFANQEQKEAAMLALMSCEAG